MVLVLFETGLCHSRLWVHVGTAQTRQQRGALAKQSNSLQIIKQAKAHYIVCDRVG